MVCKAVDWVRTTYPYLQTLLHCRAALGVYVGIGIGICSAVKLAFLVLGSRREGKRSNTTYLVTIPHLLLLFLLLLLLLLLPSTVPLLHLT